MTVMNMRKQDHTKSLAFLDDKGGNGIQRYDVIKYRQFDKLTDKQLGFFWRPEEVDVIKDCLLYTSPSPRDLSTSRMPSSA